MAKQRSGTILHGLSKNIEKRGFPSCLKRRGEPLFAYRIKKLPHRFVEVVEGIAIASDKLPMNGLHQ